MPRIIHSLRASFHRILRSIICIAIIAGTRCRLLTDLVLLELVAGEPSYKNLTQGLSTFTINVHTILDLNLPFHGRSLMSFHVRKVVSKEVRNFLDML